MRIIVRRCTAGVILQRWGIAPACIYALLLATVPVYSQQDVRAVRAAYIHNLAKSIAWEEHKSRIALCYFGEKNTGAAIEGVLDGKYRDSRVIRVLPYTPGTDPGRWDVLYASGLSPKQDRVIFDRTATRKILTIGDTQEFTRRGGVLGLVRTGNHIQLDINLDAAAASGFQISSRVLNLAVIVHSRGDQRP